MQNKVMWFVWFVVLCLVLFASVFISRHMEIHPMVQTAVIAAVIIIGAILHFHYSGNLKRYPIQTYREVWKDSRYGDTVLYEEGIKTDMNFIPWQDLGKISVTTVDNRSGTTVVALEKGGQVHVMVIDDINGFKAAVSSRSGFTIETGPAAEGF